MLHIAHLADAHIRSLSRHDEVKIVINELTRQLREQCVDHIFIGGDIFHTKTQGISPEVIDILSWWFEVLAEVAPVHIILGNHDFNIVNKERHDVISAVVNLLHNPRVHLYKRSGVYEFAPGYNWCVFSIYDEENWLNVQPVKGAFNIATYHGQVSGAKTEADWLIEGGIAVEHFKDYDLAFLGDIHAMQFLATKNTKRGEMPWIGYPGSLLQNTYAESIDHGYLIWDIETHDDWSVRFCALPNPKPYVTIDWHDDIGLAAATAQQYPKGSRFRVKSIQHISQNDVQELTTQLQLLDATEVTFKVEQQVNRAELLTSEQVLHHDDLRNPDVLLRLIRSYLNTNHKEEVWQNVGDTVKTYLATVSASADDTRNVKWSLRNLKFDNTFAYDEGNSIDFDKLNGVVGIFGANRGGKSSITGTLMYALFNTTDRGPMKNMYVCNVRKPYCLATANILVNGVDYIIERQTVKRENRKGVKFGATQLNIFRMNELGERLDLVGEQRTDTECVLRSLIGNSKDFLLTSLCAQGEINQFILYGSAQRWQILSRFLDLDVFAQMYDLANKDANVIKAQLRSYAGNDWTALIADHTVLLQSAEKQIVDVSRRYDDAQERLAESRTLLARHSNFTPVSKSQVDAQQLKVNRLNTAAHDEEGRIAVMTAELEKISAKLVKLHTLKSEYDINDLRARVSSWRTLTANIVVAQHAYENAHAMLTQYERSLKILDNVPCSGSFPTCRFIKDACDVKDKIESQRLLTEHAHIQLNELCAERDKCIADAVEDQLDKVQQLHDMSSRLVADESARRLTLVKATAQCQSYVADALTATTRLQEMQEALKNDENVEVVILRSKIDEDTRVISRLDADKMHLASLRGKLISDIDKLTKDHTACETLSERLKVNEMITSAFSRKGVPSVIVSSQLPVINSAIAEILAGIVDFIIELEVDEDSDSMDVYINYGDSRRIIELASGMEKLISSIAIRVALINVSSLPKTDMFIIDEGFSALDDMGVEACNRLLISLKRYFKTVIVITHVDGVKDAADTVLEITKREKNTHIVYDGV